MKFICRECAEPCILKVEEVETLPKFCPFLPFIEGNIKPKWKPKKCDKK